MKLKLTNTSTQDTKLLYIFAQQKISVIGSKSARFGRIIIAAPYFLFHLHKFNALTNIVKKLNKFYTSLFLNLE